VNRHRVNADAIGSAAPGCHFYFARRVTFLSCADSPESDNDAYGKILNLRSEAGGCSPEKIGEP